MDKKRTNSMKKQIKGEPDAMINKKIKVLIITKKRNDSYGNAIGLTNAASLADRFLNKHGVECKSIAVIDNNCIDKEVSLYKPTHVIIEALWVVAEKFPVLMKLHPNVKWIVRIHSELPFLANEGIAFEWLNKYFYEVPDLYIAANNIRMVDEMEKIGINCVYLPNMYDIAEDLPDGVNRKEGNVIDIGCFGAVRPMKNQFTQACAAIRFADENNMKLRFHINGERIEQKGQEVIKNIRNIFRLRPGYELIEHSWMPHREFLEFLKANIDIGLQVSFSETFNIVTADYITAEVPCVVSKEINWLPRWTYADANDVKSISKAMERVVSVECLFKIGTKSNKAYLNRYNKKALKEWIKFLNEE